MRHGSLRLRLAIGGSAVVILALIVAGTGLLYLFERHVSRRVELELRDHLRSLAAAVVIDDAGRLAIPTPPVDPEFDTPLSGLYWQVGEDAGDALLRSKSLWDGAIALPADLVADGAVHRHLLPGPGNSELIVLERRLGLDAPDGNTRWLRLMAAADRRIVTTASAEFRSDLVPALALLALVLIGAGALQLWIGLRPLATLGRRVGEIRTGRARRLARSVPDEVVPLVDEINALLDLSDETIERSRRRAADLAHGLKTPLTALAGDARRLRETGASEIADDLDELAAIMRRHIDHELARSRIRRGHGRSETADLGDVCDALIRTLKRTPAGVALDFGLDLPAAILTPLDRVDLTELLGNLLENAVRFARDRIAIAARIDRAAERLTITIADDGPGVPEPQRRRVLEPGVRLDRSAAGSGLGLAIAGDIAAAYGGTLALSDAPLGGLLVTVSLPMIPD